MQNAHHVSQCGCRSPQTLSTCGTNDWNRSFLFSWDSLDSGRLMNTHEALLGPHKRSRGWGNQDYRKLISNWVGIALGFPNNLWPLTQSVFDRLSSSMKGALALPKDSGWLLLWRYSKAEVWHAGCDADHGTWALGETQQLRIPPGSPTDTSQTVDFQSLTSGPGNVNKPLFMRSPTIQNHLFFHHIDIFKVPSVLY